MPALREYKKKRKKAASLIGLHNQRQNVIKDELCQYTIQEIQAIL